jgi:hypothetical protein
MILHSEGLSGDLGTVPVRNITFLLFFFFDMH